MANLSGTTPGYSHAEVNLWKSSEQDYSDRSDTIPFTNQCCEAVCKDLIQESCASSLHQILAHIYSSLVRVWARKYVSHASFLLYKLLEHVSAILDVPKCSTYNATGIQKVL